MVRILSSLLLFLLLGASAAAQVAGAGRSFVLTLPGTLPLFGSATPVARLLLNSGPGADVRLLFTATGRIQNLTLPPGGAIEIVIDSSELILPPQEGTFRRTVQIEASAGITAALLLDKGGASESESYAAIPDSLLGFEYIAVSTASALNGSFLTVMGIEDATEITITPTVPTRGGLPADAPFTVTLGRGEVYQMLTASSGAVNLTGSRVVASRPVGVLSGAICGNFAIGAEHACNPLIEQLPDMDSWGNEFVVGPLVRQERGLYSIVARCDGTSIRVNGGEIAVLMKGQMEEFENFGLSHVTASQPVLMVQWGTSTARSLQDLNSPFGDPSMVVVPSLWQWGRGASLYVPAMEARRSGSNPIDWQYFIQVMIPSGAEAGLLVDGLPPVWAERHSAGGFIAGSVEVGPGNHLVDAGEPFATYVYGYSATDAFAASPGSVTVPWPLRLEDIIINTCLDPATVDTTLTLNFILPDTISPMKIDSVEFLGGVTGVVLDDIRNNPISVPAQGSGTIRVRVRITADGAVPRDGRIVLHGDGCNPRVFVMKVRFTDDRLLVTPGVGSTIDFGSIPGLVPYAERTITLSNPSQVPMTVLSAAITPSEYSVVSPSFPAVIPPGESIPVTLRFMPLAAGAFDGRITFVPANCPEQQIVLLRGVRLEGGALSSGPLDSVRLLCAPKSSDTITAAFVNLTDSPVTIVQADIIGPAAAEFSLPVSPVGSVLQPGERGSTQVIYTPGPLGVRTAALRLISSDADTSAIPFDVRNDSLVLAPIEGSLDFGVTDFCSPSPVLSLRFANRGTVTVAGIRQRLELDGVAISSATSDLAEPGDTVTFDFVVGLTSAGAFNGGIRLRLGECGDEFFVPARGRRTGAAVAFSGESIDFGLLNRCDSLLETGLTLENRGDLPDTFDLVHLPSTGVFQVVLPGSPIETPVGVRVPVTVRFRPAGDGAFRDSIVLRSRACGNDRVVYLQGARDGGGFVLSSPVIDFGVVQVPLTARATIMVTNTSTVARALSAASLAGDLDGVRIVGPVADTVVPPGGMVELEVLYTPSAAGDTLNGMAVLRELSPCPDSLRLAVRGRSEERMLGLRWEESQGLIGEEALLRLRVEQRNISLPADTLRLRTAVRFDASMLFPLGVDAGNDQVRARIINDEIRGGGRVVTIEVEGVFPESGVLAELRAVAALGAAETTPLAFAGSDLRRAADSSPVRLYDTIDGLFRTLGLCREGGTRLLGSQGFLRLSVSRPNPVRERGIVEFETIEQGATRLLLYDPYGNEILVAFADVDAMPGRYAVTIDATGLPSGSYWLLLQTPSAVLPQSVRIVK